MSAETDLVCRSGLRAAALGVGALLVVLVVVNCYWQPGEGGARREGSIRVRLLLEESALSAVRAGLSGLQSSTERDGLVVLVVLDRGNLTGPDRQNYAYTLFNGDPTAGLDPLFLSPEFDETTPLTANMFVNQSFLGLRGSHVEVFALQGGTARGECAFTGLSDGEYIVIARLALFSEGEDAIGYSGIAPGTVTVGAQPSTTVSIGLQPGPFPVYDHLLAEPYSIAIVDDVHPAGGSIWLGEMSEILVGGAAREYRGSLAPNEYGPVFQHHLYFFEPRMNFNRSATFDPATIGSGRLNPAEGSFLELRLVTNEMLLSHWTEYSEVLGSPNPWERYIDSFGASAVPRVTLARIWDSGAGSAYIYNTEEPLESEDFVRLSVMEGLPFVNLWLAFSEAWVEGSVCFDQAGQYSPSADPEAALICAW